LTTFCIIKKATCFIYDKNIWQDFIDSLLKFHTSCSTIKTHCIWMVKNNTNILFWIIFFNGSMMWRSRYWPSIVSDRDPLSVYTTFLWPLPRFFKKDRRISHCTVISIKGKQGIHVLHHELLSFSIENYKMKEWM